MIFLAGFLILILGAYLTLTSLCSPFFLLFVYICKKKCVQRVSWKLIECLTHRPTDRQTDGPTERPYPQISKHQVLVNALHRIYVLHDNSTLGPNGKWLGAHFPFFSHSCTVPLHPIVNSIAAMIGTVGLFFGRSIFIHRRGGRCKKRPPTGMVLPARPLPRPRGAPTQPHADQQLLPPATQCQRRCASGPGGAQWGHPGGMAALAGQTQSGSGGTSPRQVGRSSRMAASLPTLQMPAAGEQGPQSRCSDPSTTVSFGAKGQANVRTEGNFFFTTKLSAPGRMGHVGKWWWGGGRTPGCFTSFTIHSFD